MIHRKTARMLCLLLAVLLALSLGPCGVAEETAVARAILRNADGTVASDQTFSSVDEALAAD